LCRPHRSRQREKFSKQSLGEGNRPPFAPAGTPFY
jgi:hypothetical protein